MRTIIPADQNPALREHAQDIPMKDIGSAKIKKLIKEMKELMAAEEFGVAIAAAQVGEPLKLFIVSGKALTRAERVKENQEGDAPEPKILPDQVYINPTLVKVSRGKKDKHEGCLSIRGKWGMVPRAEKATIKALDENGVPFTRGASGFLAHIYQHEMDHLTGILYTDKANEVFDDADTKE